MPCLFGSEGGGSAESPMRARSASARARERARAKPNRWCNTKERAGDYERRRQRGGAQPFPRMSEAEEERRPRPIGVADESDEDSDMERSNGAAGGGAGAGPAATDERVTDTTAVAAPEEIATKKVSKKTPAFSENDLVKEKGLRQVYKDFPRKCQYKGRGREVRTYVQEQFNEQNSEIVYQDS